MNVRTWLATGLLIIGFTSGPDVWACTCPETLTGPYADARILMLVRIGRGDGEQRDEEDPSRLWTFEILEVYRGVPAMATLQSEYGMCGAPLVPGVTFLIATDDSGRTELCRTMRVDGSPDANAVIGVLRAHKSGLIPELTEPWYFLEKRDVCRLTHRLTIGGGALEFFYRFRSPEQVETTQYAYYVTPGTFLTPVEGQGAHPSTSPGFMNLRVSFAAEELWVAEHSGRVVVGPREWPSTRTLMEDAVQPYEVIDEKGAREILAALVDASSVSLEWRLSDVPLFGRRDYPDFPDASSRTDILYFGSALKDFEACVRRGVLKA
jgi:hypothetical protein